MLKFNKKYFLGFLTLFVIEVLIAIYLRGGFIRHTFGDFLVVIMLYCFLKSIFMIKPKKMALIVLIISFTIEFLQLIPFLETLNLEHSTLAKLVFGSTFHVTDLIAYTLGVLTTFIVESRLKTTA